MKALWNNAVLADSDQTIVIEGNRPWKGEASYYDLKVNGEVNKDAAWYYSDPKPAAHEIKDYIAFWHGVKVEK